MDCFVTRACASVRLARGTNRWPIAAVAAAVLGCVAPSAQALTIIPVYDSSITSLANAAAIETAFNTVATEFDHTYARNVTVKIGVSWGKVDGRLLGSGNIAASWMNLLAGYSYSSIAGMFRANATANPADANMVRLASHLPAKSPAGSLSYVIPYAEAQAEGYLPASMSSDSGYVGFSSAVKWDYSPTGAVTAGYYDFQGLAAHEISEVLGRITGLYTSSPTWATPVDALRYSAAGASSFSYSQSAYFSIDGGATNLGAFNVSGGGDRTDWLSGAGDAQDAYLSTGVRYALSSSDKTLLDVLGWGAAASGATIGGVIPADGPSASGSGLAAVPEPMTWVLMLTGLAATGAGLRRSRLRSLCSSARA